MPRWTRKRGGLLREAGIERKGFQEWRYGVGGGLGVRCGCELFAKRWGGEKVWCQFHGTGGVCFQETQGAIREENG